jgi:hypothetical protein
MKYDSINDHFISISSDSLVLTDLNENDIEIKKKSEIYSNYSNEAFIFKDFNIYIVDKSGKLAKY